MKTKRLLSILCVFMASIGMSWAASNLTSGKTVVPLAGLKTYQSGSNDNTYTVSETDLQKITKDGNQDNVFLFPENDGEWNTDANKEIGIQGFYIDMGETKSIGFIQSTWEGANCSANIYVTDTEPAADGTLTGETLIATFDNGGGQSKDAPVTVDNSGRYIVFKSDNATNWGWGVKIRTFAALEKEASVLTSLEVTPSMVKVGENNKMTLVAKDQYGLVLTEGVTYTASNATIDGDILTAENVGDVVITATYNGVTVSKTITATNVSAPTINPTEPKDRAANVIAVYSAKYNKGINDSNPTWGTGGGAPNPLYTSVEAVEITDGHKVVHVKGAGFNSRTADAQIVTSDYDMIHVALYPFTATTAKIFGDNNYSKAITVTDLVPGQWNYVEVENTGEQPNYILIELVGEQEFYLDHFYFAKTPEETTMYNLNVGESLHGSVAFSVEGDDVKQAEKNDVVTVSVIPDEGYSKKDITVRAYTSWDAANARHLAPGLVGEIEVTAGAVESTWTFTMPEADVWVVVTYTKDLQNTWIQPIDNQIYTGEALEPAVVLIDGENTLTLGEDYTVDYADNVNVGTATVTVTAVEGGDYSGTVTATFTILSDKSSINAAISDAEAYYNDIKDSNPDAAATLLEVINAAKVVQENADATQAEVDDFVPVLSKAVEDAKSDVALKRINITIPAKSYVARVNADKRQMMEAVSGVSIYSVKNVTDSAVELTAELTVVDAGMPYLIYNDNNEEVTISTVASTEDADAMTYDSEHFKGTLDEKVFTDEDMLGADYYVLSNGKDFVQVKNAGRLDAGRCWIELVPSSPSHARALVILNEGGLTGVNAVNGSADTDSNCYNLSGLRVVGQPVVKGVYLKAGKKFIVR